jgi:predicted nucleotidyltransferase
MPEQSPVLHVCSLLNGEGAKYLLIGGQAVILHGIVRATEDVDILIESSEENCKRVLAALSKLEDGAAKQLAPSELQQNVVVKIADEVEVDVSTHAWKVGFSDAAKDALEIVIDGIRVPYLGLDSLIASKETYREKDALDLSQLRHLKSRRNE